MELTIESGIKALSQLAPELKNDCESAPIFIFASGWRTGSTLLQRLLMPSCFVWGEPFGHAGLVEGLAAPFRCCNSRWPLAQFFYRGDDPALLTERWIANLYPSVQDLLWAHQRFFETVFGDPARRAGRERWGFKEVRLSVDHALYLRWLFPKASFVFLVRNPYDAWRSYAAVERRGGTWYHHWPHAPLTLSRFAKHWCELAGDFLENHQKVGGILVKYEQIIRWDVDAIEGYLGFPLVRAISGFNPRGGLPAPLLPLSDSVCDVIESEVAAVASRFGYLRAREAD